MKRALIWLILPIICVWARRHEAAILRRGAPLDARGLADARRAGVRHAERVRTLVVDCVPPRLPFGLRALAARWQWGPSTTAGMSLGYGIFVRADQRHRRELLLHELVHTAQYERLGFRPFLRAICRMPDHRIPAGRVGDGSARSFRLNAPSGSTSRPRLPHHRPP